MTHEEACAALVVILTFALGIGLDTAVSNIVNAVLDPSCFRIGRI